jgi:hypothetical protein
VRLEEKMSKLMISKCNFVKPSHYPIHGHLIGNIMLMYFCMSIALRIKKGCIIASVTAINNSWG